MAGCFGHTGLKYRMDIQRALHYFWQKMMARDIGRQAVFSWARPIDRSRERVGNVRYIFKDSAPSRSPKAPQQTPDCR